MTDSAQDASSHVSTVTEPVLYEFNVLQVIFDDTDQVTQTFLLLFQMLKEREAEQESVRGLEQLWSCTEVTQGRAAGRSLTCLISRRRSASTL